MYEYGSFFYSLDKIKLKGRLTKPKNKRINPGITKISYFVQFGLPEWCECINEYESLQPFKYRYAFTLRVKGEKEGVFAIFEYYNGDFREQRPIPEAFMIEYNPNKSGSRVYDLFLRVTNYNFKFTEITSFDIAYDLPNATVNDILIDTKCDVMTYGKTHNKTHYIAPKEDRSGRIKVYNKHKERELQGIEMSDTLRIEASVKCKGLDFKKISVYGNTHDELFKVIDRLNSVKIKRQNEATDDWKVFALSHLQAEDLEKCLAMMSINVRSKYRKLIINSSYYTLDLELTTFIEHIGNLLKPYERRFKVV